VRRSRGRRPRSGAGLRYSRVIAAGSALGVTFVAVLGGVGVLPTGRSSAQAQSREAFRSEGRIRLSGGVPSAASATNPAPTSLPAHSGTGRRIVFDISDQRVWLVVAGSSRDAVRRTYLVSGSLTDNLRPGTYSVYSRSLHAWGVDESGTMQYMVRFAHGPHAAIGFHDIPVLHGALVQTRAELGTPRSHGCIRQWRPDARALWAFAPVGTKVVVLA
jgi:L,D-transpeptidase catalytic domain